MATYQVLGRTEFLATETPRIYYVGGANPIGTISCIMVSPSGTTSSHPMTQVGSSAFWYLDVPESYAQGAWGAECADFADVGTTAAVGMIQWGVPQTATVAANDARDGQRLRERWDQPNAAMVFYSGSVPVGYQLTLDINGVPTTVWADVRGRGEFTPGAP